MTASRSALSSGWSISGSSRASFLEGTVIASGGHQYENPSIGIRSQSGANLFVFDPGNALGNPSWMEGCPARFSRLFPQFAGAKKIQIERCPILADLVPDDSFELDKQTPHQLGIKIWMVRIADVL